MMERIKQTTTVGTEHSYMLAETQIDCLYHPPVLPQPPPPPTEPPPKEPLPQLLPPELLGGVALC